MPAESQRNRSQSLVVVTDSSACLPPALLEEHGIITVPLSLQVDGTTFDDGDLPEGEVYARLAVARRPPSTATPGPGRFIEAFRRAQEGGAQAVLCVTLSGAYSGTVGAARAAAEIAGTEIPGLRLSVVDSGALAMVHGFAVLEAARAATRGATLEEAEGIAREVGSRGRMAGVLETARYLARGGRVPRVLHWAAAMLSIRPVLAFEGGRPRLIGRPRTMEKGIEELLRYLRRHAGPPRHLHVSVMHAAAPERAARLADRVRTDLSPAELFVAGFTPVMGIHTGPGFLGLAFYSDEGITRPEPPSRHQWLADRDTRVLEQALGELPDPSPPPVVIVLSGLPGAGKSTLAREIVGRRPFVRMDSDQLRKALVKVPKHTQAENFRLFRAYHEVLRRLLSRGHSVICDATNLRQAYRQPLYDIAEGGGARVIVVNVTAPEGVMRQRLSRRGEGRDSVDYSEADWEVHERMRAEAEPIRRPHLVADTSGDIGPVLAALLEQIDSAV